MTRSARVAAQAKINLLLRVLAREASGYHSIETVFLRLDLADEVRVRVAAGRTLDCGGPAMPTAGLGLVERNLAYRAAAAYADATGWPHGFAIEVVKHIPVGGGLGGGSADAGAVLRALDALSPNPLGPRLIEIAAPLGADVPFMSLDRPMALAWGHGERLFPLRALPRRPVALFVPDFAISTADAYAWVSSARGPYAPTSEVIVPNSLATWESIRDLVVNDFQAVIVARHPEVAGLVRDLESFGAAIAMLSGSGSTVFGIFNDETLMRAAVAARVGVAAGAQSVATSTADGVAAVEVLDD